MGETLFMTNKDIPLEYREDYHKERIDENNQILKNISLILSCIFLVYLLQYIFLKNHRDQQHYKTYLFIFSSLLSNALLFRIYGSLSKYFKNLKIQDIIVHTFYLTSFFLLIGLNILDMQISTDYLAYAAGLLSTAFLLRTSFTNFSVIAISGMIIFTAGLLRISGWADNSVLLPMIVVTLLSLYIQYHSESTRCRIFLLSMSLKEASIKDPLTKAYNRRFMMETLISEIAKWERNQIPLSLLMLDIDHFKRINDEFSHSTGDQVLREISRVIFNNIRGTDLLCRYGGEEFTIILINADKDAAFIIAERIRQAIENFPFCGVTDMKITTSLGVGIMQSGDDEKSLVHRADENLYKSKRNGRNRTTC